MSVSVLPMKYAVILYKNMHLTLSSNHHDQVFSETFSHHVLSKPATNATDERIRKKGVCRPELLSPLG